jgi:hypothetical protein
MVPVREAGAGMTWGLHEHVAPKESGAVPGLRAFRACKGLWACLDGEVPPVQT